MGGIHIERFTMIFETKITDVFVKNIQLVK